MNTHTREIKQPKVFISYSWSSPEHQEWVLDLAKALHQDNIHVVLDKWDLRPGQDSIDFMEQMVKDPTINKIIMIIDNAYTTRADDREGGVGTESTILSKQLYSQKDQNNIVAVIAEPNAKSPVFYASRIHIDLSNPDTYASNYEDLIRWLYDRYKYERPTTAGTTPSFITVEENTTALYTNTEYRIAMDALEKGKPTAIGAVRNYLNKLNSELSKLSLGNLESEKIEEIFKLNIYKFQPHLLEFKKIVDAIYSHSDDTKIYKNFRSFFQSILNHGTAIPNGNSRLYADIELFKFIIYQCFLSYIAILLKNEKFSELKEILDEIFIIPNHYHDAPLDSRHYNFCIFKVLNFDFIKEYLYKNYGSPLGSLLKELQDEEVISFQEVMEADLFLYLKSLTTSLRNKNHQIWWPYTGIFLNYWNCTLRIFLKSEKPSYFNEIKDVLGCEDLSFIDQILSLPTDNWGNRYIPKWPASGIQLDLKKLTNYENLTK